MNDNAIQNANRATIFVIAVSLKYLRENIVFVCLHSSCIHRKYNDMRNDMNNMYAEQIISLKQNFIEIHSRVYWYLRLISGGTIIKVTLVAVSIGILHTECYNHQYNDIGYKIVWSHIFLASWPRSTWYSFRMQIDLYLGQGVQKCCRYLLYRPLCG